MRKLLFAPMFVLILCFGAFGQDSPYPTITLIGPASALMPDQSAVFTVSIDEKAENLKLEYFWSVDKGKIFQGQRTMSVTIGEIPRDTTVIATVEIKGLPEGCLNTASETTVPPHSPPRPLEIEQLKTSDPRLDKLKFDKLISALKDEPSATAYIIIYADEKTSPKQSEQKEQQIRKYLSDKNVPANMIVIVRARERKDLIRLFIVPQGAEPPTP